VTLDEMRGVDIESRSSHIVHGTHDVDRRHVLEDDGHQPQRIGDRALHKTRDDHGQSPDDVQWHETQHGGSVRLCVKAGVHDNDQEVADTECHPGIAECLRDGESTDEKRSHAAEEQQAASGSVGWDLIG
jgi:hypothetical protein